MAVQSTDDECSVNARWVFSQRTGADKQILLVVRKVMSVKSNEGEVVVIKLK